MIFSACHIYCFLNDAVIFLLFLHVPFLNVCLGPFVFVCEGPVGYPGSSYIVRSTLRQSRPNKAGVKFPCVHPYPQKSSSFQ